MLRSRVGRIEKILTATRKVFQSGACTVLNIHRDIADRAGINTKALLHYYFRSKDLL
ncbi:MAG: helix-turn-helix transcriptional regulator, partial [Chitinophagaceae bacterium]|nr:helix-turn-helix transcriptional regulator [Chitinophagaceae bacterium]